MKSSSIYIGPIWDRDSIIEIIDYLEYILNVPSVIRSPKDRKLPESLRMTWEHKQYWYIEVNPEASPEDIILKKLLRIIKDYAIKRKIKVYEDLHWEISDQELKIY